MAEGFVLNIPKEMLDRLQKADEKIEKLDKNSRRVGENIRLAFMEGAKGVDKFIGSLNSAQKILDGFKDRKINVGLNLDAKAIDDLKKQLSTAGVNIPVGVTGTGGGSAGESQSLKNLLDKIVTLTTSIESLTKKIDGIKVTGSGSASGSGTSSGEKTDKGIGSYKSKINELLQIEKLIHDIDKAQTELAKKGDKSLSGKSLSTISNLRQQADKLLEELTKIEEKTNKDLSGIQTKWHAKELAEEQKQSKANINIQEKEANDLIKIEEREIKEYERLMGKMLKLRKDINTNTDLIYSPNPKVSQDALAQITKQEALLKQFEARAKTLEGKYGAGLSEIQLKYSQKELEMLNKAVNNPASNSGIDQKTKDLREYEKVLKRISDLEKVRAKAEKAKVEYKGTKTGLKAFDVYYETEAQLKSAYQRRIALEQKYGAELSNIKQQQNIKDLNDLIKSENEKRKVQEQSRTKAIQQYQRLVSEQSRLRNEYNNTKKIANDTNADVATRNMAQKQLQEIVALYRKNKKEMLDIERKYQSDLTAIQQRAGQQNLQRRARERQSQLGLGVEAKTINEKIQSIKNLKKAQGELDVSTSTGKKQFNELERQIRRTENELKIYGVQLGGVREQSSHLFNISQQLGRALSLMFSVSQIGQYISKMVNVRKEMELQQRSLQVLLQSKDKANELWNQTLDLAVKSPFRVKELVTYTKQLAAYRIESDKLFETNKMLADVSAGLGVDMQRLILAFGQVKSASFLRGTELRQFTEAGIPMLEELSKYFSEIYGKSVSVAEVFDMISKRMVTFTDVEKVFQRMTGAGGVFFNMQEEQSKTLAGMISNLQDSVDLMMNEMGKKNDGLIKGFVRIAKGLVDNWELIGKISKNILATFLVMKGQIYIMKNLTGEGLKDLKEKIQDIFTLFKSNPWTLAITTVLALLVQIGSAIFKANREAKEFAKTWQELREDVNQIRFDFEFANDFDEKKAQLENIINLARQKYNLEIDIKIGEVTEENIKDRLEEIEQKIIQLQDNAKSVAGQVGDSGVGHWLSKMGDYYDKFYDSSIKNLSNIIAEMERMKNLSDDEVNFLNKLKENKDRRKGESDYQYYERLRDVFVELDKIVDNNDRFSDLGKYYSLKDLQYTYRTFYFDQSIQNLVKSVRSSFEGKNNEDKLNLLDLVIDTSFPKDDFKSLELDYVRKELMYYLSIDDVVQEATLDNKEYLRKWQKDFNQLLSKYNADLGYIEGDRETSKFKLNITSILDNEQGAGIDQKKKLEEVNKELDFQKEKLEDIIIANAEAKKQGITSFYSEEDISHIEDMIKYLTILSNLLGGDDDKSKGGKDTATQRIKDQISLIRQLYEEYQKLSKEMGAVTAKENVLSRFADYANELGLNIDNIDFTNLQGIFDSLQGLETSAESAGADAMKALTKAMGETSVELELMFYIDERKKFESQIEDMFSDYELSLELDKLNIPKNLASDLFGVDTVDLDEIKTELEKKLTELDAADISLTKQLQDKNIDQNLKKSLELQQKGNKQQRESIESNLRKISDMEQKELEERLKTYTKYLLNEQHERVKIRLETLRKLQEVEATSEFTDAQKETITNKLKEEEKESLAKQTWKDFETSPMYMQLFDDIENMSKGALEQMIVTMDGLKTELQSMGLPASDLKEILSQINKVEEELERRNPFKNFAENANVALNRSKELAKLEKQRASQQEDYDLYKSSYDNYQEMLAEETKVLDTLEKGSDEYNSQQTLIDTIQKATNHWAKEVDKAASNLAETNNQINNINNSSNDFYEQLKNIGSITKSVVDGVFQITDAMSWLPEETQLSLERMKGLSDSAFTIASGIGSIMSGDIIGGITSLISGVSGLVSLFMEWSSGAKEAAIETEKQGRLLADLQNKYDRLNKAIDEAWNVAQIKQYNAELQKNLQLQIIAQKAIIEAQKSVKGANDYGSEQWLAVKEAEEELQNLYDQQEELQKNIYSKLTAGIMDDVLSTTESFVDAWYDAFKETGDGLKGLEDNFNEMLLNLVKRQVAMKIAGRFIDEWDKALERYASDGDLSNSEIEYYANKVKNDLPALSSQLETFFSSFDNVLGDASGNLSGLQRGLTQLSESTGQELASYLNSIRFIVSDSNSQLKALLAAQTSTSASNPIVAQLQVIAQQASAINTLLNSLTAPYQGGAGRAFKVVI